MVDVRRGSVVVERRVDRHHDPDLAAEGLAQRVLDLAAQPALELTAGEVVGHRDDRGALVQGDWLAGAQPSSLVGLEVVEHPRPHPREIGGGIGRGARRRSR